MLPIFAYLLGAVLGGQLGYQLGHDNGKKEQKQDTVHYLKREDFVICRKQDIEKSNVYGTDTYTLCWRPELLD